MFSVLLLVTTLVIVTHTPQGVDQDWLRSWERAQQDRPERLDSRGRIAPAAEPGAPAVIHGRVLQEDGTTPASSAIVFAYHTDANGLYDRKEAGPHSWRLRGWTRTDADGRFEFATIRPAPYPGASAADAHVHFTITTAGGERYFGRDLHPNQVKSRREGGADHVEHVLTLEADRRF